MTTDLQTTGHRQCDLILTLTLIITLTHIS